MFYEILTTQQYEKRFTPTIHPTVNVRKVNATSTTVLSININLFDPHWPLILQNNNRRCPLLLLLSSRLLIPYCLQHLVSQTTKLLGPVGRLRSPGSWAEGEVGKSIWCTPPSKLKAVGAESIIDLELNPPSVPLSYTKLTSQKQTTYLLKWHPLRGDSVTAFVTSKRTEVFVMQTNGCWKTRYEGN